jgi:uncharacterized phage-associated protein
MYSVLDVAGYFIDKGLKGENPLTPIQVMKLCYFAHGYKLAINDEPLIDETVQAWKYGPVFQDLYHCLKMYGSRKIKEVPSFLKPNIDIFEEEDIEIMDAVFEGLGEEDGMTLSDMTHDEGTPWKEVWDEAGEKKKYTTIDNELIKKHFKELLDNV